MSRRKNAGIVVAFVFLLIGSIYILPILVPDIGPTGDQITEIEPHEFNDLNWWDIPWELATSAELLTHMVAINRFPNRHMLTSTTPYYDAAEYISGELEEYGLDTWYEGNHESLLAVKRGFGDDNRAIVFSAYLDTEVNYAYRIHHNTAGAAMLTYMAEILSNYRLSIDVYFAFPAYSKSGDYTPSGILVPLSYGSNEISDYLNAEGVDVIALYDIEGLMYSPEGYHAGYVGTAPYREASYLAELLHSFLLQGGSDILEYGLVDFDLTDNVVYSAAGFPTIHIEGAVEINPDDPPTDSIHSPDYDIDNVVDLGKALAALAVYISYSGNGIDIDHLKVAELAPSTSATIWTMMSASQMVEVSLDANTSASLTVSMQNYDRELLELISLSGEEASSSFTSNSGIGLRRFSITNQGNDSLAIRLILKYSNDFDGDGTSDADQYSWSDPNPPLDWDHDGLPDTDELIVGTDRFVSDTDMDSIRDGYEYDFGMDPLRDDTEEDLDADGLTNVREYEIGTYPNSTDTDQDTMDDLWEVTFFTNPLINDSADDLDNDNLTNIEEYTYGADPRSQDGDFDGILDPEEIERGMNPLSDDTDGDGLRDQLELIEGLDPLVPDYDVDLSPDGPDRNPRVNALLVIIGLALIPVAIGSVFFVRRLK